MRPFPMPVSNFKCPNLASRWRVMLMLIDDKLFRDLPGRQQSSPDNLWEQWPPLEVMSLDEADHSLFHPLLHCQPVWYLHHHHCICLTSHLLQLLKKVVSYFLELLSLVVEVVEFFAFKVEFFRLNFLWQWTYLTLPLYFSPGARNQMRDESS